jgi:glycosyltransferase involved in cell wall biosynthesis
MDPLVSVVITTHNLEWCVNETISSVLAQTYPRTEVIVVDDASTDKTAHVVASFAPRVKLICNARRTRNPAINRNIGIQAASGEYIAFLDGDDLWESEKLAVQATAARQYPTAGLIAVDGIQFRHEDGAILKPSLYDTIPWSSDDDIQLINLYKRLLRGCCIDTPSQILVPRQVLDAVEGFTVDLPPRPGGGRGEDYDLLVKIAAKFDFLLSRRSLVRYRYRSSSVSALAQQQSLYFVLGEITVLRRHLAVADKRHTAVVRTTLRRKFLYSCKAVIEESRGGKRVWASRYLLQLARRCPTPSHAVRVGISLARVWRPNLLSRALARARTLFGKEGSA